MKSRIWQMATVGVLCVSVSGQLLADERGDGNAQDSRPRHAESGQRGQQGPRPEHNQARPENRPAHEQNQGGKWQARPQGESNMPARPTHPGNNLPIRPRPDTVQQSQNHGGNQNWHGTGANTRPGNYPGANNYRPNESRPNDQRWPGRPNGHGNGWGAGPQYRPGYMIDRFPGQYRQVPYRGQNYYFSGGYWYRPQGPRYIVVQPPYGIRVGFLPDYAREVWFGSTLMFLAAGAYYAYQPATQDYIVVQPPATQQPVSNGYDVVAYPVNFQTPAQVDQDRYDCYRWAVDQSGFDPARVTYAPAPAVVQAYRQAQGSCLSSRGYQVTY
ncbi:DUF6515 family protein [Pseudomonas fragi]|uniref:DUF6515 family protein n=1 Tax=Pseudomonas fragi TaxID=296 RepID=UPI001F376A04|nr:DUF6515 family protein [Pseudomonas fragi]MCF6759773.1 glycine zipper family protein [Pseudomonas fragi]